MVSAVNACVNGSACCFGLALIFGAAGNGGGPWTFIVVAAGADLIGGISHEAEPGAVAGTAFCGGPGRAGTGCRGCEAAVVGLD